MVPRHVRPPRIAALPPGPFARLATLLGDIKPGKDPISLAWAIRPARCRISSRRRWPRSAASFGNYPAIAGTQDWREAAAAWLNTPLWPERRHRSGKACPAAERHPRRPVHACCFRLMPRDQGGRAAHRGDAQSFLSMLCRRGAGRGRRAALCRRRWRRTAFCPITPRLPEAMLARHGGGLYLLAVQSRRRGGDASLLATAVRAGRAPRFHRAGGRMLCRHLVRRAAGLRPAGAACPVERLLRAC